MFRVEHRSRPFLRDAALGIKKVASHLPSPATARHQTGPSQDGSQVHLPGDSQLLQLCHVNPRIRLLKWLSESMALVLGQPLHDGGVANDPTLARCLALPAPNSLKLKNQSGVANALNGLPSVKRS